MSQRPSFTKREYYAAQALANSSICTGVASEGKLTQWFGDRHGIERSEICAAQAFEYADAMIKRGETK